MRLSLRSKRLHAAIVAAALSMPGAGLRAEQSGAESAEATGISPEAPVLREIRPSASRQPLGPGVDLLLVPDSTADRVMAFDPTTGDLINADFIPADPTNLSTPKAAILHSGASSILVSDQIDDVVQQYDANGTYIGVFAPAGGPNPAILDNILGIAYRPNGNLLVTVDSGTNQDSVAEFDPGGSYLGNFIANGAGGLDAPFDVVIRASDVLVSSINTDQVLRYDLNGVFQGVFAPVNNFPEQIAQAAGGNVLVANFGGVEGIYEYQADGTFVASYDPPGLSGYRGVYELPNANLLVTTSSGVHEITRANTVVETKISVTGAQYIEFVQGLVPVELQFLSVE